MPWRASMLPEATTPEPEGTAERNAVKGRSLATVRMTLKGARGLSLTETQSRVDAVVASRENDILRLAGPQPRVIRATEMLGPWRQ